jgi:hypothetical protein
MGSAIYFQFVKRLIMKKNITRFLALTGLLMIACLYACVEPDDLITSEATEGGLITPVAQNLSFVGNPVTISVEVTDGITSVSFYKKYSANGVTTAEVLDKTVNVSNGKATYEADYTSLRNGLAGLPTQAADLEVGDFWTMRIVSKLEDGREIQSSIAIRITVDNPYSGEYASSGTRWNFNSAADANTSTMPPTGFASASNWTFDTDVTTVDATTCKVHAANDNGGFGTINIKVNADNTVEVISTDDTGLANLVPLAGYTSTYDPATKTFTLYYQYTNSTGTHRVLRHYLVRN